LILIAHLDFLLILFFKNLDPSENAGEAIVYFLKGFQDEMNNIVFLSFRPRKTHRLEEEMKTYMIGGPHRETRPEIINGMPIR